MKKTSKALAIGLCITGSFVASTSLHAMESFLSRFGFMQNSKRKEVKGLITSLHSKLQKWKEIDGQEERALATVEKFLKWWGGPRFDWQKYSSACDKHDTRRLQRKQSIEAIFCELCSIGQKIEQEQDPEALIQSLKKCRYSMLFHPIKYMYSELPFEECYRKHTSELLKEIKKGCPSNGGRKAYRMFLEFMGAPQGILDQKKFSKSCAEDF